MRNVQRAGYGLLTLLGILLCVAAMNAVIDLPLGPLEGFISRWSYNVVLLGSSALCLTRAVLHRKERAAWIVIGVGMLLWSFGNLYYSVVLWDVETIPVPSVSDVFWVAFYPCIYVGLFLLLRGRLEGSGRAMWLDGFIGAAAVSSFGAEIVVSNILEEGLGSGVEFAINLAYPVADVVLIAFVIAALSMMRWSFTSTFTFLGAALIAFAVTDSVYLVGLWDGTWVPGNIFESGWPLAMLLMAGAAWKPAVERPSIRTSDRTLLVVVGTFALAALAVLVYDHYIRVSEAALALASIAFVAVVIRLVITFNENLKMIAASQLEASTDSLTGLGNRRRLMKELDCACSSGRSHVLLLFDLDGFKSYNDTFGHPAGDALLARLGHRLRRSLPPEVGTYRMGGDEFCVLAPLDVIDLDLVTSLSSTALAEAGEGFAISASAGSALIPDEGTTPSDMLRLADGRMYGHKSDVRIDVYRQSTDVLLQAIKERDPVLEVHVNDVAGHAMAVAARLGVHGEALQQIRMAAELHDVGKVAIPDAILSKPGPLNADEWRFMHQHTVVGQRILGAAPALAEVGRLVRSSHERWDGTGYPDGLSGEAIPLGSRIVAVCDAFDAMITDRPYRKGMSIEVAIAELVRCSGAQFDPTVVDTFVGMITGTEDSDELESA